MSNLPRRTRRDVIGEWSLALIPTCVLVYSLYALIWSSWRANLAPSSDKAMINFGLVVMTTIATPIAIIGWNPMVSRVYDDVIRQSRWYDRITRWLNEPV